MSNSTKKLALMAMGIALFVVLSLVLQVPVFENYYLCLGYVVMAVFCYCFGIWSGIIVGFFGVILYCLVISGLRGMPGWALGNIVIALFMGLSFRKTKTMSSVPGRAVINALAILFGCSVGILFLKSFTEMLLYAQPFLLRAGKNMYAFVADVIVLWVSLPLCEILYKPAKKIFPNLVV